MVWLEQVGGDPRVVVRVGHQVDEFLLRRPAGLARLGLQQVHQEIAVLDHQIAVALDDLEPVGDRPAGPVDRSGAGPGDGRLHIGGRPDRDGRQRPSGEDFLHGPSRPCGGVLNRGERTEAVENFS